jgi:hypothetical protein
MILFYLKATAVAVQQLKAGSVLTGRPLHDRRQQMARKYSQPKP